jgi:hypothetical protein
MKLTQDTTLLEPAGVKFAANDCPEIAQQTTRI